jgi:hypothetical protein
MTVFLHQDNTPSSGPCPHLLRQRLKLLCTDKVDLDSISSPIEETAKRIRHCMNPTSREVMPQTTYPQHAIHQTRIRGDLIPPRHPSSRWHRAAIGFLSLEKKVQDCGTHGKRKNTLSTLLSERAGGGETLDIREPRTNNFHVKEVFNLLLFSRG